MKRAVIVIKTAVAAICLTALIICSITMMNSLHWLKDSHKIFKGYEFLKDMEDIEDRGLYILSEMEEFIKQEIKRSMERQLDPRNVFGSRYLNLAFFGLDKSEERIYTIGNFRTDTNIIVRMDFEDKKIFMFSIPRDTYIYVAVRDRYTKMGHAFVYGGGIKGDGFNTSIKTIEDFLDIEIDRYFGMDMEAIAPVVDALGGITYDVDVEYHKDGYNLTKGLQLLDGYKAEEYVRFRRSPMGDIDRVTRQQKFLMALLKEIKTGIDVNKGLKIYEIVEDMTYTNLTEREMSSLGLFLTGVDEENIGCYTAEGTFMMKDGLSYWNPRIEKIKDKAKEIFGDE